MHAQRRPTKAMNAPSKTKTRAAAEAVHEFVATIARMESEGNCRGIAAVVIDQKGDVHRLTAYASMQDLVTLLGGTVTVQHKLMSGIQPFQHEAGSDVPPSRKN